MFKRIRIVDTMMVKAWVDRSWSHWIGLWLASALAVGVLTFLVLFVPGFLWMTGMDYYHSIAGVVAAKTNNAPKPWEFASLALLDGEINGFITLVAAPLLMAVQEKLGDFVPRVDPVAAVEPMMGD